MTPTQLSLFVFFGTFPPTRHRPGTSHPKPKGLFSAPFTGFLHQLPYHLYNCAERRSTGQRSCSTTKPRGKMSAKNSNCCSALSRGHTLQGVLGILGTLALMISATTPQWYNNSGLWESQDYSDPGSINETTIFCNRKAQEAQLFFIGMSLIMAAASFCTCLLILFCWKAREYSQDDQKASTPAKLFLTILSPTGFFFSVGWTIFTWQHLEEIQRSWTGLGYSYWLGVFAWTLLVICIPVIFLFSECILCNGSDSPADILEVENKVA